MKCLRWLIAIVVVCRLVAAQALGHALPLPNWHQWMQGDAVAFGDEGVRATVWAFYRQRAARFAGDAAYLADLQRRFGGRGIRVVAVVGAAEHDIPAEFEQQAGCAVALDQGAVTAQAWAVDGDRPGHVLVADSDGQLVFRGQPASGLIDAVQHLLAGEPRLQQERVVRQLRVDLPETFDDIGGDEAIKSLRFGLRHAPHDGLLLGLLFLAEATKRNDGDAALQVLADAGDRLATEQRPLAVFADLVLRGNAQRDLVAKQLLEPLQVNAALAPNDPGVQLAYLRALVVAGDHRQVGRHAVRVRQLVTATPAGCLDFASILTAAEPPQVHRDLATIALNQAEKLGAPPRLLTAARYGVAVRCAEDRKRARELLADYLKDQELRVGINNDCWYIMTQLPTMGRYDWFAAGLAERMLEDRDAMDYFEFDTAALAMFLVGRFEAAVELQQIAMAKGGAGNTEYNERLERYRARLAATRKSTPGK